MLKQLEISGVLPVRRPPSSGTHAGEKHTSPCAVPDGAQPGEARIKGLTQLMWIYLGLGV